MVYLSVLWELLSEVGLVGLLIVVPSGFVSGFVGLGLLCWLLFVASLFCVLFWC